jgi:hypothetical protein
MEFPTPMDWQPTQMEFPTPMDWQPTQMEFPTPMDWQPTQMEFPTPMDWHPTSPKSNRKRSFADDDGAAAEVSVKRRRVGDYPSFMELERVQSLPASSVMLNRKRSLEDSSAGVSCKRQKTVDNRVLIVKDPVPAPSAATLNRKRSLDDSSVAVSCKRQKTVDNRILIVKDPVPAPSAATSNRKRCLDDSSVAVSCKRQKTLDHPVSDFDNQPDNSLDLEVADCMKCGDDSQSDGLLLLIAYLPMISEESEEDAENEEQEDPVIEAAEDVEDEVVGVDEEFEVVTRPLPKKAKTSVPRSRTRPCLKRKCKENVRLRTRPFLPRKCKENVQYSK